MGRTTSLTKFRNVLALFKDATNNPTASINELQAFLVVAGGGDEGISLGDVETQTGMSQVAVSRNVAALSKFDRYKKPGPNLIELKLDPQDYRRKFAHLTSKGVRLATQITEAMG